MMRSHWLYRAECFCVTLAIVSAELQTSEFEPTPSRTTALSLVSSLRLIKTTAPIPTTISVDENSKSYDDILSDIARTLGPNYSSLLILGLVFLLAMSLLAVAVLIIRDVCRSRRNRDEQEVTLRAKKMIDLKEEASSVRYTCDPANALGQQTEVGKGGSDETRETFYSDDFEGSPDTYLNIEELKS